MTTPGPPTDPQPAPGSGSTAVPVQKRRGVPAWVWILLGVLVVGGIVAAVLAQANSRPEPTPPPPPPPAATVTLPPPSPTVAPIDPGDGTAFFDALPRTLLSYALASSAEDLDTVLAGALEAYTLTYTDGGEVTLTVQAAQYADAAQAGAALDAALATVTSADATPAPEIEEGVVEVDGTQVGRFVVVRSGEQSSVLWTNGTAVLRVGGPADAVQDAYAAFPL